MPTFSDVDNDPAFQAQWSGAPIGAAAVNGGGFAGPIPGPQNYSGAAGGSTWSPGQGAITAQQVTQQYGADPSVAQYWADKINTGGDPNYYIGRLQQDNAGSGPDGRGGVSGGGGAGGGFGGGTGAPVDLSLAGFSAGNVGFQSGPSFAGQAAPTYSNTAGNFGYTPMGMPQPFQSPTPYTPQQVNAPTAPTLATITQPGQLTPQQVSGQSVTAGQVQGPGALSAQTLTNPTGFQTITAEQAAATPGFQFQLQQGENAIQNSAAAQGMLHSPNTLRALNDYAQNVAQQDYQLANQNALQAYQTNFSNQAQVAGQNNAAQAQAYGLTNQYQQQAALANQGANLNAQQFNAGQGLQAQLANQSAGLNAGQFNAGMNFNTQQQNVANQLAGYNAYQPLNQQAQQFNATLGANAAQQNFANQFNVGQFNTNTALAANNQQYQQGLNAYDANVNAQLGFGQLNNAAQANANSYNLGMANNALGYYGANQSYNLGLGNLALGAYNAQNNAGLGWGQLGLGYANYGLAANNQSFGQQYELANMGLQAAGQYGNYAGQYGANAGNLATQYGNAGAAGTVGSANAYNQGIGNAFNAGLGAYGAYQYGQGVQ